MRTKIEKAKTKRTIVHFIWQEREKKKIKKKQPLTIIRPPYAVLCHIMRKRT
jgi:hypothetical protein